MIETFLRWGGSRRLLQGYLVVLMLSLAALPCWPSSRPLLGYFYGLLAGFFGFAFLMSGYAIVLTYRIWNGTATAAQRRWSQNIWQGLAKVKMKSPPRPVGLWDRWLDGG